MSERSTKIKQHIWFYIVLLDAWKNCWYVLNILIMHTSWRLEVLRGQPIKLTQVVLYGLFYVFASEALQKSEGMILTKCFHQYSWNLQSRNNLNKLDCLTLHDIYSRPMSVSSQIASLQNCLKGWVIFLKFYIFSER